MSMLFTMPLGQGGGHRALAHLLAAHSIATPKQAKEPISPTLKATHDKEKRHN
ncbi:MAG: hypothetical protein JNL63_12955 [Bacteroidia bacterium]|nr:hypothetical protein [Bacteroidia bacterium]